MPDFRVDSVYDLASIEEEQAKFLAFLAQSKAAILDLNNQRVAVKTTDVSTFTQASESLNKSIAASTVETQKAATSSKQLTAAQIENRLATQMRTASIKNDVIENKSALGSYDQLNATLKRLTMGYKAMSLQQRNSAAGQKVKQNILDTKNVLKSLDAGIGDHQRNVGNYTKSIGGFFSNLTSSILAYGAAYLGLNAIKDFFSSSITESLEAEKAAIRFKGTLDNLGRVDAFDRLQKKAVELANKFKYLDNDEITGVFEKLVTYGKLSENQIDKLTPVIINFAAKTGQSVNESASLIIKALEGNGKALKEFGIDLKDGKTEAERFGIVMNDLGEKVKGAADTFGETTQGKIAATSQHFKDLKEEIGTGLLPVLNKGLEGVNGLLNGFKRMADEGIGEVLRKTFRGLKNLATGDYTQQAIDLVNDEAKRNSQGIEDPNSKNVFIMPADTNSNQDKAFGAGNDSAAKSNAAKSLQELKERLNTEFDIYKIAQEAKIRLFQNNIKDESTYYLDKLTAFDNYLKAEKELLEKEEQHEIDLANNAATREKQHLEEQKKGKSGAEQARIDQNILINQQNLEQQILLIKAKYADEGNKLIEGAGETRNKIVEDHLKTEQELYDEIAKSEQKNIEDDTARIKKGFEERAKAEEEAAKKKIELLKEVHDKEMELASTAGNFIVSIATSSYEKQLNLITDQSNALTKRKDEELAANDATVQSAQDKAANVILINARAQSQQDALDRKAATIKNKEAQFERAQQIFEIGITTIKTLAAIKLQAAALFANPLTAALAPLALAQIPIALATSALSIGAILAKPLPHYKHGRGEKGEELAVVGDGGVNEFIWRQNGKIEKTPAVNTLTHLMPKDKVYPNKESLMRELMFNNMQLSDYSVGQDGGINRNDINKMTSEIVSAVGDIRIQTQLVTKSGWRTHNEKLAQYDAWVNRVIKN